MTTNELRTTRAYLNQATKFFVHYEKAKRVPDAMISFNGGFLLFEAEGEAAVIRAEGEWNGRAWISASYLAALYRAPPTEKEVVIRYADGRLRISTLSIKCRWENVSDKFIARSENPTLIDLLAFDRTMHRDEIFFAGLAGRIVFALQEKDKLINKAAKVLASLGVSAADLAALVDLRVQEHVNKSEPTA